MPRIPYADPNIVPESMRQAANPESPNVQRMLANASEGVFNGFSALTGALLRDSSLPSTLREVAVLRLYYIHKGEYAIIEHEALVRHLGMSDQWIDAIRNGDFDSPTLDDRERAVLRFTDDILENIEASDKALAGVRAHLTDMQVVDLIIAIGGFMTGAYFLRTTGVEVGGTAIDWSRMPKDD